MNNNIPIISISFADELKFVDPDIQLEFENKNYIHGTPTNVQLSREIRNLRFKIDELIWFLNESKLAKNNNKEI